MSTVATDSAEKLYYRIGEVEQLTRVPAYVLRYWETEFKLLRPKKNPAGQRVYRQRDLDLVRRIKTLLYDERLTRPAWHVAVAGVALLAALAGAVAITLANRETEIPQSTAATESPADGAVLA